LPEEAGVRITTEIGAAEEGAARTGLRLAVVDAPGASDQVLDDAQVFLEPEAAALLDDKVLDADVAEDQVHFNLKDQ
jgi:hypothetical protein